MADFRDSLAFIFFEEMARRSFLFRIDPPALALSLAFSPLCLVPPVLAAGYGYGSVLRYAGVLLLPALALAFVLLLVAVSLSRRFFRSDSFRLSVEAGLKARARIARWACPVLCCSLMFFAGWKAGSLLREKHCRELASSFAGIIEKLERELREKGAYPAPQEVRAWKAFADLSGSAAVRAADGNDFENFGDFGGASGFDATLFVTPCGYTIFIPVEKPFPMSFTKFHALSFWSGDREWRTEDVVWFFRAK